MLTKRIYLIVILLSVILFQAGCLQKNKPAAILTIASTTSLQDSGLCDELLPFFEKKYNCQVRLIASGSGQAIRLARDGNADLIIAHDKEAEEKFVADGYGEKRIEIFKNNFVLVGPTNDSAGAKNVRSPSEALKLIARKSQMFISRGDSSGTHKREISLWKKTGITPTASKYIESGNGMIETLRIADEKSAYTLTDGATFLIHKNEFSNIDIIMDKGKDLDNPYSVIVVSRLKYPNRNYALAQKFVTFITKEEGASIISNYGLKQYGKSLFTPITTTKKIKGER